MNLFPEMPPIQWSKQYRILNFREIDEWARNNIALWNIVTERSTISPFAGRLEALSAVLLMQLLASQQREMILQMKSHPTIIIQPNQTNAQQKETTDKD